MRSTCVFGYVGEPLANYRCWRGCVLWAGEVKREWMKYLCFTLWSYLISPSAISLLFQMIFYCHVMLFDAVWLHFRSLRNVHCASSNDGFLCDSWILIVCCRQIYICVGHENIFFLLCNRNEYAVKKFISSPSSSLILSEIFRILLTVRRRYWISWWLKKERKKLFHIRIDKIEFSLFFMFDCETFFFCCAPSPGLSCLNNENPPPPSRLL